MKKSLFIFILIIILSSNILAGEITFDDMGNHWAREIVTTMCVDGTISRI